MIVLLMIFFVWYTTITDCQNMVRKHRDRTVIVKEDEAAQLELDVSDIAISRVVQANRVDLVAELSNAAVNRIVHHFFWMMMMTLKEVRPTIVRGLALQA